ncbi:MAG: Fe-S cluster assembly protein SufD [Planctomycetota bacterium]|nr:MAG: Fe-S cluster assembly protein SufD [Planctomycetota bacterium]
MTPAPPTGFNSDLLERLLASSDQPAWAVELRRLACERLESLSLPDRGNENWMRTDLRMFQPRTWAAAAGAEGQAVISPGTVPAVPEGLLEEAICQAALAAGKAPFAGRVATLDGRVVREELDSAVAAQGVVFGTPERVLAEHGDRLRPHWFSAIDSGADWFAAMHAAFHRAGAILHVPAGVRVEAPLHLLSAVTPGGLDTGHVLVVLEEGAEATFLTETAGGGDVGTPGGCHCGGTEIIVGRGASLRMVNLQNWNRGVWHFARQRAKVGAAGRLQWTLGALGSRLSQVQQDVALVGRGADAQVNGVMFTEGRQQLVYNTLQHHQAPGCHSDLLYKGALQDKSRLVWRGMIKVDKVAQKTDGYQRNDTLMLSRDARSDSIPGLEIEADDVRCTHGATSGRVDDEQIFYAQTRGLTADEAARLVVAGFFQQVFDRITIPPVREALSAAIGGRIRRVT